MTNKTHPSGNLFQRSCIWLYGLARRSGILSTPVGRRFFESAYETYKLRLEAGQTDCLKRWAIDSSCVVDVGANIGFFTRRFAEWVGPHGRVVAIEPEQRNLERLRTVLEKHGLSNRVDIFDGVAAEIDGELNLKINPDHPGDHRIGEDGIAVRATTLDTLLGNIHARSVSFIKVDVQGAELRVLAGARATLRKHRPTMLIEIDPDALDAQGATALQLADNLAKLGYRMHKIGRGGKLTLLGPDQLEDELASEGGYLDVLCLPVT